MSVVAVCERQPNGLRSHSLLRPLVVVALDSRDKIAGDSMFHITELKIASGEQARNFLLRSSQGEAAFEREEKRDLLGPRASGLAQLAPFGTVCSMVRAKLPSAKSAP